MSVSEYSIPNICCDQSSCCFSYPTFSSLVHNKGLRLSESNDKFNSQIQQLEEQLAVSNSTADDLKSEIEHVTNTLKSEKDQAVQALKSENDQVVQALKSENEQVVQALKSEIQQVVDDIHELEEQKTDLESMLEDRGEEVTTLEASLKACTDVSNSKTLQIGKLSDTNQDLNKALQSKTEEANESKLL